MELKLLNSILSIQPQEILYHYTSQSGLYGIITSRSLWATDIHYVNDSFEFSYAIDMAKRILDSKWKNEIEFTEMIKSHLLSICSVHKYVFSLTAKGNLLSQWRGYCPKSGGYALGFDSKKLTEIASRDHEFYLYPCCYDVPTQHELIQEVLKEAFEKYLEVKKDCFDPNDISKKCWGQFTSRFEVIASIVKDPSWSEEHEWRLASPPLKTTHPQFKIREGKYNLIPYIEIPLGNSPDELPFKKVIVGPTPHQELAMESVGDLLSINNLHCSVERSFIPFRDF